MSDGRKYLTALAVLITFLTATLLGATGIAAADPDKPDLKTVAAQVDDLEHQAEIASERYNDARTTIAEVKVRLSALNADLAGQQGQVDAMRGQVAAMVVDQYQSQGLSTASQLVLSDDPDRFLDNLRAMASYQDQRGEVMAQYRLQTERLEQRRTAVREELSSLSDLEAKLAANKRTIDEKSAQATKILDKLNREEAAKLMGSGYTGPVPDVAPSGRASAAIKYAMAQVGKSYVYGATGPSSFDCSGLTMRAWGAAGVGLPHSSSAQYGTGTRISESQLQPGDLVFYYSPISHVGMYIGNGLIVNAQNPRTGVKVTSLHAMPYVGAVRPG